MPTYKWDAAFKETLVRMWKEGYSAKQISDHFGGKFSRNAVISKIHRLGLSNMSRERSNPRASRPRAKSQKTATPIHKLPAKVIPFTPPPVQATDIARKSLADLEDNECRWPVGDPGKSDFGFCALEKIDGLPYCQNHANRAYNVRLTETPRTAGTVEAFERQAGVKKREFETAD